MGDETLTCDTALLVTARAPGIAEVGYVHVANALGANTRVNATVGRFAQLVRLFCGRAGGVLETHGTVGHPGRISFCVAEHPQTAWPPFHTQLGHAAGASVASVVAAEGPNGVNNHYGETGAAVLET